MSCNPHIKANSNLGKQLGLTKDTSFNSLEEIKELINKNAINNKSKDFEIYKEAAKRAIDAIKQGKQVVFDTTNLTKEKRRPFIEAIKKEIPNANIQYKLMPLNPELAKQRIKAQLERGENRAAVSDETIDRHAASYKQMLEDIKSEPISNFENQSTPTIEDALIDFASNYSYTVEINTAGEKVSALNNNYDNFNIENDNYQIQFFQNDWELGIEKYLKNNKEISQDEYGKAQSKYEELKGEQFKPTQHYSNLTVPGGTNYTENEIATPAITPSIKGHAQFSTDNGIGWFRSDEQVKDGIDISTGEEFNPFLPDDVPVQKSITTGGTLTKTRRILEVQSDLFQKGRDKKDLVKKITGTEDVYESNDEFFVNGINYYSDSLDGETITYFKGDAVEITYEEFRKAELESKKEIKGDTNQNQFLQLLNKDNNWVTFFIKAIIQDSAKKGYEKVLFPLGDTSAKIEGHETLEEFKKQKEDRIKELEKQLIPETNQIITESLNKLNVHLENYLNQFGFNTEQLDDLKQTTGYSIIGATDFLEKTIFVQKENIDKAYTKEAAYTIFNLLGRKNLLRKDLIASIHLIDNYEDLKSKYTNSKLSDYLIRELIAIDYLQSKLIEAHKEALPTSNKAISKDVTAKNKLEYTILRIKKWWSDIIRKFFKSYKKRYIEDVFNQIANDVINNNTRLFNLSKNVPYKKMELIGKQKEINDSLVKFGAINSGSYSLNRQGNLTRYNINDLDYFLPYQIKDDFIKNVVKKYPQAIFSEPYSGVMGNRSLTLSLEIDGVKIDFFLPTSQEESDKNKIVIIDGVKYHHWKNIFDAKVRIGSQKHLSDLAGFTPFTREWSVYNVSWRNPLILKDDYLNIVGQRHYNFDFIQSKYNSKEYSSGEQVIQSDNIKTYWDKNLEQTALNYFKNNNIDFEKSIQYQNLLSYFNNKRDKAIIAYYLTFSENFKKFYGNIDSRKNLPSFVINSISGNYSKNSILLDEYGDPVIFYHGAGTMFDKFSKDYFLSGEGAMAYGAGFYSTNYKPTADNYRDTSKAAMETFRKLLEEQNQQLLDLISKLKVDINENVLIGFMSGSLTVEDSKSKTELLNLLGLTETKALYIALTNPLYWQKDISKINKDLIESHFGIKLKNNNSGKIYRELEKTLKISDKELSARLYQIGIDGVINIAGGGQAVGGFSHKKGEKHVIFFEPIQAKAVNNSGLFSLNNENMYDPIEIKENKQPQITLNKEQRENNNKINNEINQLKQELERVEKEGFVALKPIYKFYEETITNILKKQGYNPMEIVDEYGNMWNEVEVDESARNTISFSPDINDEQERDYENTNSGPNTFDTVEQGPLLVSDYTTYIEVKKAQLGGYMNKLRDNIKEQESAGVSPQRLSELHREERALRLEIYGNKELEIKGIKDEIAELEDNANTNSVAYYIERELERLAKLSVSQSPRDITEARRIIDLLVKAGTFSSEEENPFFDQNVIFEMDSNGGLTSTYLLDERTRNTFAKWRAIAEGFKNIVDKTSEEIAVNTIKGNSLIQNTYRGEEQGWTAGTIFNKETGLKDTDWFSMWFLDPTHGLLSTNGIVPQVMIANLVKSLESKERWSREMAEYMDRNSARVNSALMEMGETTNKFGIVGIKTGVYNIFKRLTAEGNETHDLVQRQTKEYDDETSSAIRKFWIEFKKASAIPTFIDRNKKANIAFRKLKEQRRKSSIIVDVARLEDEEYLQSLINLLGERDFEALLDEQLKAIDEYNKDRQTAIEVLLLKEEVNTYEELSEGSKNQIKFWDARNSPYVGVKDYYSVGGMTYGDIVVGNYMKYNKFIPRKYKANITVDDTTRTYKIEDTKELTGYWDENYLKIHSNKVVSDFYYKLKEFCEKMYEELPYDIKESSQVYTFPGLVKTTAEVINTHTEVHEGLSRWSRFYRSIWDRLRTSFGVIKESTMSYTARDPITGKDPYTVNDSFFRQNHRAIEDRKTIEKTKFLQAFNSTAKIALPRILRGTELYLSQLNTASLIQLAEYLHVDITVAQIQAGNIEAIKNKLKAATVKRGDYIVPIGRLIQDYSKHVIVQSLSFDLPKLVKHFSELAMAYSARKDALPINSILKEHYSKIKAPETTSTGETIWKRVGNLGKKPKLSQKGARVNANRQLEEHFERVHLNKYNKQHHWAIGRLNKVVSPDQENVINKKIAQLNEELKRYDINNKRYKEIKNKIYRLYSDKLIPFMGRNIYTTEERLKVGQLRELIEKEKNKETITKLQDAIDKLGKIRTVTATLDNFLNWVRFLRLGYNVSSGVTNFAEGLVSNLILGATDEYFDTKELYWAYRAVPQSFVKNGTLGWWTTPVAKKTRMLADKYNLIVDSRNILQKNYSDRFLSATNSFAINQRTEYINQTPLMIAVLRTMKITGINGQESSVWDALDTNGNLRQEFRTEENVKNWESLTGETYQNFKNKVNELIMIGHGNYSKLRGMMIKSNGLGRMLMMFKTWLPEMIFWRFAAEQDNIFLGKRGFKGRYRSYGGGTGALHGATVGAVLGAFPGMAVGAVLGGTIGALLGRGNQGGIVDNIYETMSATKLLIKKLIGIPVNVATFGERIATNKRWTKKARYFSSSNFTQQDSNNLYANMTDLAIQLLWLALVLVVKKTFWDDDDEAESQDRKIHNVLVNRLLQLSNQAAMYVNPTEMKDNTQNIAVLQYLSDAGKWVGRVDDYIAGRDMENGESRLWKQTRKMFLPGMFRDSFFGIEGSMERVYPKESPWHRYFKSEESIEADRIKRERATLRKHLLDSAKSESGYSELPEEDREEIKKEIEREVNERIPTLSRLKKLGLTREQYEENHE